VHAAEPKPRVQLQRLFCLLDGSVVLAGRDKVTAHHAVDDEGGWIELTRSFSLRQSLFDAPSGVQQKGEPMVCRWILRLELNGLAKFMFGSGPLVVEEADHSEDVVRFGERPVELESPLRSLFCLWPCLGRGARTIFGKNGSGVSQPDVGEGIVRVLLDRLLEVPDRLRQPVSRSLVPEVAPLQVEVVRREGLQSSA
jgi:hypothetical protein